MARTREQLKNEAMELNEDDRLVLATQLFASVPPDSDYERAWDEELQRRLADHDAGRTKAIPADEVFAELRKRFG